MNGFPPMASILRLFYIVLRSITIFEYRNTLCSVFSLLPTLVVFHVTCIHLIGISWDSNPVISNNQATYACFIRKVQKRCNYGINVLKKKGTNYGFLPVAQQRQLTWAHFLFVQKLRQHNTMHDDTSNFQKD